MRFNVALGILYRFILTVLSFTLLLYMATDPTKLQEPLYLSTLAFLLASLLADAFITGFLAWVYDVLKLTKEEQLKVAPLVPIIFAIAVVIAIYATVGYTTPQLNQLLFAVALGIIITGYLHSYQTLLSLIKK